MKKIVFMTMVLAVSLAGAGFLFADTASGEALVGRDIVDKGSLIGLKGTLYSEDGEWYLESGGGEYYLHLGPYGQDNTLGLKEGASADVQGFAIGQDVAVTTIMMNGKKLVYRSEDGRPAWSGTGEARGQGRGRS